MFRKTIVLLLASAWCLVLASPAAASAQKGADNDFAEQHAELIDKIEIAARHAMDVGGIPGMSIALADENGLVWSKGFGYTDSGRSRRVDSDTIFSIQSISKTVTATAIVEAANRGLLDLDRPITDYLPDFTVNSVFEDHPEKKMTLRHLLSHTAGFTHEAPIGNNDDEDARSFEKHIASICETWLRFPVGKDYGYSNLGIDLAGYILQKISGQPFESYVDENLTGPAGMANSTFDIKRVKGNRNRAVGHSAVMAAIPVEVPMIPAGGFYASAGDMAKFIQHHLNNADALQTMYTIPFPINRQTEGYCLGVVRADKYNTYYLNHNGGGFGFLSSLTWYPELGLGVAVLTNNADSPAGFIGPPELGMDILDAVITDPGTVYHERQQRLPAPAKPTVSDSTLETKLISDVQLGLLAVKGKPMPDEPRLRGYEGVYTATETGMPFFAGVAKITQQYGRLLMDGNALTEVKPGLFFTGTGEELNLNPGAQNFRGIPIARLPLGMAAIEVLPFVFLVLFVAAIVLLARRGKKARAAAPGLASGAARIVGGAGAGLSLLFLPAIGLLVFFAPAQAGGPAPSLQVYHLLSAVILLMKVLSPLVLLAAAAAVVFCAIAWAKKWWKAFDRIQYTVSASAGILFVLFLLRLNMLIF